MKSRIAPAARKHWQEGGRAALCIPPQELRAIDVASGAFTRPQAEQRAVLYSYCKIGHNVDLDGIAIVGGGQVVAHLVFEGAANTAIGALPDLNNNGLAEIVIASGGTNMGETGATWRASTFVNGSQGPPCDLNLPRSNNESIGPDPREASAVRLSSSGVIGR